MTLTREQIAGLRELYVTRAAGHSGAYCIEWTGKSRHQRGYGVTRSFGRACSASRAMAEALIGEKLPREVFVCHKCDNPPCINPAHLFLGTHADNMRDMSEKGRGCVPKDDAWKQSLSRGTKRAIATGRLAVTRGEQASWSKLKEADVLAIRASGESQTVLAARYGVNQTLISQVKRRKVWAHV